MKQIKDPGFVDTDWVEVEANPIPQEIIDSMVNSPKHYQIFPEYEVRDLCEVMADRMEGKYTAFFISDYVQFLQYVLRFDKKNGQEDLEKAQYYLNKMIENHP